MTKDNLILQRMIQDKMNENYLNLLLRILNNIFDLDQKNYHTIKNQTKQIEKTLEKQGGYHTTKSKHKIEDIFFRLADCECEVESEMTLYTAIIEQEIIYENIVNELLPQKDQLEVEIKGKGIAGPINDLKEIEKIAKNNGIDDRLVVGILEQL